MSLGPSHKALEAELLRHSADIIVELAVDGRILYVSEAVESVLAQRPNDFVGRSFLEVIVPEDRDSTLAVFQKVVATGAQPIARFRVPRSDGLRIAFEATLRTFKDAAGQQRVVANLRDNTQQSAEIAVAQQRAAYYRAIVESGLRPAAVVTPKGAVLFSNQRFKAMFGRDIHLYDIKTRVPVEIQQNLASAWFESHRNDRDGRGAGDFEYTREDGETSWIAATWEAFQTDDGQRNISIVYEDISQRKRIEHALQSIAVSITDPTNKSVRASLDHIARALEFDFLTLGIIDRERPGTLNVVHSWREGAFLDIDRLDIADLPDAAVAAGETCIYPSGVVQLIPQVAEKIGRDIESYAGIPLRSSDGSVLGLIGGYGRKLIADPQLTRSLLSSLATHVATAMDRARASDESRKNQDRFNVLARQANELLVEVEPSGIITYVSDAIGPLLGHAPENVIGRRFADGTHPEDRENLDRPHRDLTNGIEQTFVVVRARHADGSWRWFETRTSTFTASDGTERALVRCRDITEQRRAELTRTLLYRVVQQGADLVFICETDTTLLFANTAATERLREISSQPNAESSSGERDLDPGNGQDTSSPIEGRTLHEILSAEDAKRLFSEIIPDLTPASVWSGELSLQSGVGGDPIPTEARVFLIVDESAKQRTYLAVTMRDILARRTAEEALRLSEFKLNQAQKMEAVGRLAGGIAHDFNNLLTAIIGYSDLVLDEIGEGHGARRDVEEILRAAERAGGLTRQLLAFSRRQVLQPESIDLNSIVADTDRMMRRLIGENIELVTRQDGELRLIVADPGQIEQVLVNLVVNARDAMPQGGRLEIETANLRTATERHTHSGLLAPGDYVVLKISDTGTGMTEETRAQIFEPFFTTKDAHHGTGLGLASVHGIVRQSDGQIDVATNSGTGTQFTIYFPVARVDSGSILSSTTSPNLSGRETILLVEDDSAVRKLVARTLQKSGYKVLSAESATAALRHCSRHQGRIDLILSDVVLPKMAGPEIARRAKELRPEIRVLFISGFTDETLARHGLDASRAALLEKPFTPRAMLSRVRELLDADDLPE